MKYRVGKCPVCGRRVGIYMTSRVKRYPEAGIRVDVGEVRVVIASHRPIDVDVGYCNGYGMEPAPDPQLDNVRARRDSKRRTLHERLTAPFRDHAHVALDAFIDARPYPELERSILLRVAVHDLNENHRDHAGAGMAVAIVRYAPRRNKSGMTLKSGDLYCSFCGELRLHNVKSDQFGRMFPSKLRAFGKNDSHAIECALQHLAFDLEPAAPTFRKLPDEYVVPSGDEATA